MYRTDPFPMREGQNLILSPFRTSNPSPRALLLEFIAHVIYPSKNLCICNSEFKIPPASWTPKLLLPSPPPNHSRLKKKKKKSFGFPASYSKFPLAIYFTYGGAHVSMLILPFGSQGMQSQYFVMT